jgi:RNA polymerase sigma-70 factor (ECF subfamily)
LNQDREKMLSVRNGDIQKLGQLYDKHAQGLYNYFQFQIKDSFKCEDLVQTVFYKILKYRHTFKNGADFKVWMYTIARNEKINYFSSKKPSGKEFDPEQPDERSRNPENELEDKTNKNHLNRALERISSDNRELLILSKFTGLPYNKIAEIFGCTVGAVKVRIYRAMKELKVQYLNIAGE